MHNHEIIAKFQDILTSARNTPISEKGRKIEAFTYKDENDQRIIRHPATYLAYSKRLRDFKYLVGIQKELPLDDLSAITNKLSGSFRLPLHLYLHQCLPDYPKKARNLEKHRSLNAADQVMRSILSEVESLLDEGKVADAVYAQRLSNNDHLIAFASDWLETARLHTRILSSQKTQVWRSHIAYYD